MNPTVHVRIIVAQLLILVSILSIVFGLGFLPASDQPILQSRIELCETLAIAVSHDLRERHDASLHLTLAEIVRRNADLRSIATRDRQGHYVEQVADHLSVWQPSLGSDPRQQLQTPLWDGHQIWGQLEVTFWHDGRAPLFANGLSPISTTTAAWLRCGLFLGGLAFVIYYLCLNRISRAIRPSSAVPEHVRAALNGLAGGLLVIDRDGRIVLANRSVGNSLQLDSDQLLGRLVDSLPWVDLDHVSPPWRFNGKRPASGTAHGQIDRAGTASADRALMQMKFSDGRHAMFLVGAAAVLGEKGERCGTLVGLEDVSELEEARAKMAELKQLADAANDAKTRFLAGMSHELRTPMNAVLGFTDFMRRELAESAEERREYLDIIHHNGSHLLHLINDILDLSKVESGKLQLESAACSPAELLQELLVALGHEAEQRGIYVRGRIDGVIPSCMLLDSVRLRQIMTNLVSNAIKFTSDGGVTVTLRSEPVAHQHRLAIVVADTGIGMPAESLATIFEPFQQADSTVTRRFGGTGLGLPIARDLACAMGGGIDVVSQPGLGTTFTAFVLADHDPESHAISQLPARTTAADQLGSLASLHNARILIADDGASNRKLFRLILTRAGASVDVVANGREAIQRVRSLRYDAILMDMQMPVLDGYAATQQLRQIGCQLPIVALTAAARTEDQDRCLGAGCTAYLTKPVAPDVLTETVAKLVVSRCPDASRSPAESVDPTRHRGQQSRTPGIEAQVSSSASSDAVSRELVQPLHAVELIRSSLPTDDPEFESIVREFLALLPKRVARIQDRIEACDFKAIAELGHWLRGSSAVVGFSGVAALGEIIEDAANERSVQRLRTTFARLAALTPRLAP